MKDVVLDTNIIIDDPSILAQSRDDVRLIVPAAVLGQAESYSAARRSGLASLIRRAAAANKVKIVPTANLPFMVNVGAYGLDYIDLDILSVAVQTKAENSETVLATKDIPLRVAAAQNNVDAIDGDGLKRLFAETASTDLTILRDANSVTRALWIDLVSNAGVAFVASVLAVILSKYWHTVASYGNRSRAGKQ